MFGVGLKRSVSNKLNHGLKPPRILLVDDEPDIAKVLKIGLGMEGYQVDAFTDPREAISHFKADYYDLLLLDFKMPHMNGFELSMALVKLDSKPKVCFMTAFEVNLAESHAEFPGLKVDAFMKKPLAMNIMVKVIQTTLKAKKQS